MAIYFQGKSTLLISVNTDAVTYTGSPKDYTLFALGGDDVIDGDAGTDTEVFSAASTKFTINTLAGVTKITGLTVSGTC